MQVIMVTSAGSIDIQKFIKNITALAEGLTVIVQKVSNMLKRFTNYYTDHLEYREEQEKRIQHHRLNFKRPIIRDQVKCRKPKHMVRKIIH